ncbi:peptidylprolyl isomerase [Sneathiella chinensis]|uniref:Parvulin-like PPIase n=1 Tax=Sneathiella chinensis TaxID=349750 RepID=A0ABQ5U8H7_9PROT|nr:peptidylprolyl isomerase [Sneathiella chinensis]GLQ07569.1 hypothetical protein GCM10007924_27900 [Sneathiella chinensis]
MTGFRKYIAAVFVIMATFTAASAVRAQDVQRIVAVVNDEVISGYDVLQRISLTIAMSGFSNDNETRRRLVQPTITRLIDDRLKLQEAARFNLTVSDMEMNEAIDQIEKANNIPSGQIDAMLENRGIDIETLLEQVRAGLAWRKVVGRRIVPRILVSDEEVAAAQARLQANKGKDEYLLSEIFIPVETPSDEPNVRRGVNDLIAQLRNGASFPRVASQFSQGPSAANGGNIGWTMAEDVDPEIAAVLPKAKKGGISSAIRTPDGYYIVAVRDIRKILDEGPGNSRLTMSQLAIPVKPAESLGNGKSQMQLINSVSRFIGSCDYVPALLEEIASPGSGTMGTVSLNDMPEKYRNMVKDLKPGQASAPYLDEDVYRIFIVCDRQDDIGRSDSEEAIRQDIGNRRIEARARRYLQDLHREATIEMR